MATQTRLSYQIIGAAIEVHKELGPGLLESVYEHALCIELEERQINFRRQVPIDIDYKGCSIGHLVTDIIVENRAIVEVKSVQSLAAIHTAQLMTYLKLTRLKSGLLINFNESVLKKGLREF